MNTKRNLWILPLFLTLLIFSSIPVKAQSWVSCSVLPESMVPYSVSVNGKIYAVRGNDFYSGKLTEPSYMYEYDPAANSWTKKGQMSVIRTLFGLIELNGKIYAIGGISNDTYYNISSLSNVEVFDPSTGIWQSKKNMPKPLYVMGIAKEQGKIYVAGGNCKTIVNSVKTDSTSNQFFEYNPDTDTWTKKASMSKFRSWYDAVGINGKIVAVGGNNGNTRQPENSIEEYDIASDKWTDRGAFTNGIDGQCQAIAIKDKVYTISADNAVTIGEYDPAAGKWTAKASALTPLMDFGKVVYNDKLYLIGGHLVSGMTYSNKVIKYDPAANSQVYLPNISQWMNGTTVTGGVIYAVGGVLSNGSKHNGVVKYDTKNDPTAVEQKKNDLPGYGLMQNYPNPFNPSTTINYNIPSASFVELKIFDTLGCEVQTLVNNEQNAGTYNIAFDGSRLSSGIYFARICATDASKTNLSFVQSRKMMLVK